MAKNVRTPEELERMSPEQRRVLFESSIVTDLADVPPDFLNRVRSRTQQLIEAREPNPH